MSSLSCIINHFTGPELNPEAEERFSVCETDDDVIYDDTGIEDEGKTMCIIHVFMFTISRKRLDVCVV